MVDEIQPNNVFVNVCIASSISWYQKKREYDFKLIERVIIAADNMDNVLNNMFLMCEVLERWAIV